VKYRTHTALNIVTSLLKARILTSTETAVAREQLCKLARCETMAQQPSHECYIHACNNIKALANRVFYAVRAEVI
jgi:hypothetical protein